MDDNCITDTRCAILSFTALKPRVFSWSNVMMLCDTVRAVFVGVLFTMSGSQVCFLEKFRT